MESKIACNEVEELLCAYYDGELLEIETECVNNHIQNCDCCAEKLANYEKLSELLANQFETIEYKQITSTLDLVNKVFGEEISCHEVLENLSAYYDEELPINTHYSIQRHLEKCDKCADAFKKLEQTSFEIKRYLNNFEPNNNQNQVKTALWGQIAIKIKKLFKI